MHPLVLRLTAITVASAAIAWPAPPPPAAVKPVTYNYFGTTLTDPYAYFENLKSPEVQHFFREQADYTNAVLSRLGPGRDAIRRDVARLIDAGTAVNIAAVAGGYLFYFERPAGVNDARLMVRDPSGKSRLLLDPDALAKQTGSAAHFSLSQVLPSPDGSHVAVGIVPGGDEPQTHTRVIETATGTLLPEDFPRTWFGVTSWSPDGKVLFYNQLPLLKPGESQNDRELRSIVFRHELGSTTPDTPVFGIGLDPNVPFVPTDSPIIGISPASPFALGVVGHGVQNELTVYVAPVAAVTGTGPIPWRKIADVNDDVTGFDIKGNTLFLLSHKDAAHFKVLTLDLSANGQTAANATTVVPNGPVVIQQVAVASDGLYIRGILSGIANLRKIPFNADGSLGTVADVKLPFSGTLQEFANDPLAPGVAFDLVSWTKPLLVYTLSADGTVTDTGIRKPPAIDTSQYTSIEVKAPSADGTLVPLSIVMRRGTKLDGTNPTYLEAYGSYGLDIDPYFLGARFAWLDDGGIWAVAHVRGGGENGQDWYLAGKGVTKQHTIDDAIGAARYLIANKYTSPKHLGIEGTSAGGIMVGGAITQHPELFAGALDAVGLTNPLRAEDADPNGAGNVPEFGSAKTKAGFEALYKMDAYQHIVNGKNYPAVMGITGINDPRVAPWMPAKFVARLQAASASGRPVLLRVDYDAGHGLLAASSKQTVALLTDEFSFLMWQLGSPHFTGIPTHIVEK